MQKQITEVELLGLNLTIMRGEKIPMMIVDYDRMQSSIRSGNFNATDVEYALYEMVSGWYIIDGIKWRWYPDPESNGTTFWRTEVRLTRREWPIPGRSLCVQNTDDVSIVNTAENMQEASSMSAIRNNNEQNGPASKSGSSSNKQTGSSTSATGSSSSTSSQTQSRSGSSGQTQSTVTPNGHSGYAGTSAKTSIKTASDDNSGSDMPLTGLKTGVKNVYKELKTICPDINLVSARRWAVDEAGNRVEGNAFVKKNGLYKCCNAKGEIMYFKNNNSRHMYGEAFDIINRSGQDFNGILTKIMGDQKFLGVMADNGVALCIEKTTDDCGTATKHYHFGTDEEIQ